MTKNFDKNALLRRVHSNSLKIPAAGDNNISRSVCQCYSFARQVGHKVETFSTPPGTCVTKLTHKSKKTVNYGKVRIDCELLFPTIDDESEKTVNYRVVRK